jgi:arsenate reductase (thioredoxin)
MSRHRPLRVLFVCTGNSCRSIMAEALLREHGGTDFEVHSGGTFPKGLNERTMDLLADAGIDASWARSKSVTEFLGQSFDYVITVCDDAREACPVFPGGGETLHWGYPDPAAATGSEDEIAAIYRRTFRAIGERIGMFIPMAVRDRDEAELATAPGASV